MTPVTTHLLAAEFIQPNGNTTFGVGWISLALINAGLAQSRGRRGWVWFLLSLPLGPIATFLLVTFFRHEVF